MKMEVQHWPERGQKHMALLRLHSGEAETDS